MTQPRGQQVKSVNARYSVLRYAVTPGTASTSLSTGLFPYAPGGAAEDVPGRVIGTVSGAIPVLGGDTISVRVNGAPAVPVVLASTDTTVGRIVLRVNAALALPVASSASGFLVLSSTTSGATSSIEIADGTPGMLAKVGMAPGVYSGKKGPSDGLVTLSQDGLGGIAPLATVDGKNVVTDGGKLVYFKTVDAGAGRALMQLTPGGVPVVGRTVLSGSNVVIGYYAKMIDRVRVRSLGSFFSLLDNTNTLSLTVNNFAFTVGFPSGPYTRDQVLDLINAAYAASLGITDTWARVDGTVPAPFSDLLGTTLNVDVDGVHHQVLFSTNPRTVAEVKAVIEGQVPGITVAGTPNGTTGPYLYMRSSNPNGRTSSLRVYAGTDPSGDYNSSKALSRLGLRAGYYGGCYVADQYGPDEIEVFSSYRGSGVGSHPSVTVGGGGTTLTRIGLTAGTYSPSAAPSYFPVSLPSMTADESLAQGYDVLTAYESVLEFGDVPDDADVALQQYLAKSAGTNVYPGNHVVFVHQNGSIDSGTTSRGFFDVGKPIVMSPDGILSPDAGGSQQSTDDLYGLEKIVRQIVALNATDIVQATLGLSFSGTVHRTPLGPAGAVSGPFTPSYGEAAVAPYMLFYSDPTNAYGAASRGFRFYQNPTVIAAKVEDDATASPTGRQAAMSLFGGRSFLFEGSEGRVGDANTLASGDTDGYLRLSSSQAQERYISVGGRLAINDPAGYNVLRNLNARYEVYVGDGTSSFGDFSGPDAISKALAWMTAAGITRCRIVVKPGTAYSESAALNFASFVDVAIEGLFSSEETPSASVAVAFSGNFIIGGVLMDSFALKNVKIDHQHPTFDAVNVQARSFRVQGCDLNAAVRVRNAIMFEYKESVSTVLDSSASGAIYLTYDNNAVTTAVDPVFGLAHAFADVRITRSRLTSSQNKPILSVVDATTTKQVWFRTLLFESLSVQPGNLSVSSNVINSTEGVGILGITPANNAYQPLTESGGLVFEDIVIRDVDIICGVTGTSGTYGPAAIWITPRGTAASIAWDYYEITLPVGYASDIRNVTVENVEVHIYGASEFATNGFKSPPVVIAGVGIKQSNGSTRSLAGGTLRVDGLDVYANGGRNGSGTAALAQFLGNPLSFGGAQTVDSSVAGLIALSGGIVDAKNITADGTVGNCINSTLLLCPYYMLKFDGFSEEPRVLAGGSPPSSRVIVRDGVDSVMDIKNFYMSGNFLSDTWCTDALVLFECMSDRRVHSVFSNFYIAGFSSSSSGNSGIRVSTTGIARTLYSGTGGGLVIRDGYVGNYSTATRCQGVGINASVSSAVDRIGNLTIQNVVIDSMAVNGILINSGKQQYSIVVEKCDIRYCGNSFISSGFKYTAQRASGTLPGGNSVAYIGQLTVRDNYVAFCNTNSGGYFRAQINLRDIGSSHYPNIVNFYGNMTNQDAFQWSYTNITRDAVTSLTSISPNGGDYNAVRGAETGYTGQVGSFTSLGQGRIWATDYTMLHNNTFLMSDVTDTD